MVLSLLIKCKRDAPQWIRCDAEGATRHRRCGDASVETGRQSALSVPSPGRTNSGDSALFKKPSRKSRIQVEVTEVTESRKFLQVDDQASTFKGRQTDSF